MAEKSAKKNGAARKYPQAALLFNRVYKEVCVLWGSTVLSLKDEKNTATLQSMMKGVMENGGKIGNYFHWK
jgi:hypothetical protein